MSKIHEVEGIKTTDMHLYLTVDGQPYRIKWTDCSTKLEYFPLRVEASLK